MYEKDSIILAYYLFVCSSVFIFLTLSERTGFKVHKKNNGARDIITEILDKHPRMKHVPVKAIETGLSLFIIGSALLINIVPVDFAISSLVLLLLLLFALITGFFGYQLYRLILFVTIGFSVYLLTTYPVDWLSNQSNAVLIYFIVMAVLGFITVKTFSKKEFNITPLDYLVIVIALLIEILPVENEFRGNIIWMIIQIIILFYICELLIQNMRNRLNRFTASVALALALFAYRGLA